MFKQKLQKGKWENKIEQDDKKISIAKPLTMKKRILITEDDDSMRDVFKIILEKEGYEVDLIENGRDLLENNFTVPHLFLVDKLLSGVDGLDVCRHLKKRSDTKDIPVIMISASPDIVKFSAKAGADAYIEKPFEIKYLVGVVAHYLDPVKNRKPEKINL